MTSDILKSVGAICSTVFSPFWQWDRLRHPWAGWTRVALGVLFPFIIWSHDFLLIGLLAIAVFSHPYWFPSCVDADDDSHFFTKLIDGWQKWMEATSLEDKFYAFFPGLILFIPLIGFLWAQDLFWSIYFLAVTVAYKVLFIQYCILQENKTQDGSP